MFWVVNLGCIDLERGYGCCDDINRPDYLHFDLDPDRSAAPVAFRFTRPCGSGRNLPAERRSGESEPLAPKLVIEVQYDHFSGGRFRHGTKLLRWRPDKTPVQRSMSQVECESRSPPGYLQLEFSGLRE